MKLKIPKNFSSILEKINDKNRHYVFGGILVVIFLLDWFILMQPQLRALQKINPELKALSESIQNTKNDIQNIDTYKKQVEELKGKVSDIYLSVKAKEEVEVILERISLLANKNGVKIDQIKPDTQELEVLLENNERQFLSLPISIEAHSSYHNFGKFINELERDEIFLKVSTFTITPTSEMRSHSIKLTLKAVIYDKPAPKKEKK